jgi:hypothetical protein
VPEFEAAWAKLLGAKRALGTSSGTTALITSLYVMGVDAGCPASRIWLNPEVEFVRLGPEVIWSIGGLS